MKTRAQNPRRNLATRKDARGDTGSMLLLYLQGDDCASIGRRFGVSKQVVHRRLQRFIKLLKLPAEADAYRKAEADLLDAARLEVLTHMLDPVRLSKALPNHLAYAFRQLFDSGRLLRGQSTANVGLKAELIVQAEQLARGRQPARAITADRTGDRAVPDGGVVFKPAQPAGNPGNAHPGNTQAGIAHPGDAQAGNAQPGNQISDAIEVEAKPVEGEAVPEGEVTGEEWGDFVRARAQGDREG